MVSNPGVDSPLVWVQARLTSAVQRSALLLLCASFVRTALAARTHNRPFWRALRCVGARFRQKQPYPSVGHPLLCARADAPSRRLLTVRPLQEVAPRAGLDFAARRERALVLRGTRLRPGSSAPSCDRAF